MTKPELSGPITLRIPTDILRDIDIVAGEADRNRSWVIVRALRLYFQNEGAEILSIAEGRAEIAAGNYVESDEMMRRLMDIDKRRDD